MKTNPTQNALACVTALREARMAAIVAGEELPDGEAQARMIDTYFPLERLNELLIRQSLIDRLSPAARELEQRDINRQLEEIRKANL